MLKKIDAKQPLDIPIFLKHIRQQRNYLVQTEEQFIFIYDVLYEAVQLLDISYKDLELNEFNIDYVIQTLDSDDKESHLVQIEKQYRSIIEQIKPDSQLLSIGQMNENQTKNRSQGIIPLDACRIVLSLYKRANGGDYINASYLHVRKIILSEMK